MLGTQMPTKMAWLSFLRRNQMLTLRTKLRNAARMKKYLLLTFIFSPIGTKIINASQV
jgi:hypothetical protein